MGYIYIYINIIPKKLQFAAYGQFVLVCFLPGCFSRSESESDSYPYFSKPDQDPKLLYLQFYLFYNNHFEKRIVLGSVKIVLKSWNFPAWT